MGVRNSIVCVLLLAASMARAQVGYEPEPSLGPGLGGHRNDGIAIVLIGSSVAVGIANAVPQREGARSLAVFGLSVGVVSAITGELLRQDDSARPALTWMATGFGVASAALGVRKLVKLPRSSGKSLELTPRISVQSAPSVGVFGRVSF